MFDIDTGKLLIVAVLALIVIGPKDLPRVMRQVGQSVGKLRRMASEFQGQFMDAIKDAEIEDIRKELKDIETKANLDYAFDPARDIQTELTSAMAPQPAVTAETSVESPVHGFDLPRIPAEPEIETTVLAEGIAPSTGEADTLVLEAAVDPMPAAQIADRPKRKLFVKPHRSSFARLNSDRTAQITGQALSVRRRLVRARKSVSHDMLSS